MIERIPSNRGKGIRVARLFLISGVALFLAAGLALAQAPTANGEIEGRAAPVFRRICPGGANAGDLCNENADCPGSSCADRNVFNISVAVQFSASADELDTIEDLISAGSAVLFDVTDGQAEIGAAFIHNNAFSTSADLRIYPRTNPTWWGADTGSWQVGGSIHVSIDEVEDEGAPGESLAHEFVHLVFDARDEYETRPNCGLVTGGSGSAECPDGAADEDPCLMDAGGVGDHDGPHTELCWGHGDPADLDDISGGNHDATDVTEQSECRSNRSCWDQVVWSWPNTFLKPAGAPDPDAGGAVVNATKFIHLDTTRRVVLVLDESGSMDLETPSRMERLKVAANDFVTLAESGTELGIVSYSDDAAVASGRVSVGIDALGADRSDWTDAIDGLSPDAWTNIGDGLYAARQMIQDAGGVTANTFIVLMTDGLNNRPSPQATADAHLQDAIDDLLADGIEVYVTCTGGDLGLQSQCSEIAAGTGGFYVDSADAAHLAEAFVDIHELTSERQSIDSVQGNTEEPADKLFFVEEDAQSVTFVMLWEKAGVEADVWVIDPDGNKHETRPLPQGRYARFKTPIPGEWQMRVERSSEDTDYVARAYSQNQTHSLTAGLRFPTVLPGDEIYLYAYPRSVGGTITHPEEQIIALVTRPDGSTDKLVLHDQGRDSKGGGDDVAEDGIFTGVYGDTKLKGAYTFLLQSVIDGWVQDNDRSERNTEIRSPRYSREVRISAAVHDPADVEKEPEDRPYKPQRDGWWKWLVGALGGLAVLGGGGYAVLRGRLVTRS